MGERIAVQSHDFGLANLCKHCGIAYHEYVRGNSSATCVSHWIEAPPRPTPASTVNDFDGIHQHLKRIRAEEDAALRGAERVPEVPEAADF